MSLVTAYHRQKLTE